MNYISKVADMLGVKIGQEFSCRWNIRQFGKPYTEKQKGVFRFTKKSLEIKHGNANWDSCCLLQEIIEGRLIVERDKE